MSWEEWKNATHGISDTMLWKEAALEQNARIDRLDLNDLKVVSSHISKSIHLPVVHGWPAHGVVVFIRGNFYDWKVSVDSERPLVGLGSGSLFDPRAVHNYVYCEGFDPRWVFGSYNDNKRKFTVELPYGDNDLQVFIEKVRNAAKK